MQSNAFQLDAFQLDGEPVANQETAAIFYLPFRAVSGIYQAGVAQNAADNSLRSYLPHSSVKVLKPDGTMNPTWYKFFQVFVDVFLAGAGTYTLDDIVSAVNDSQATNAQLTQVQAAIAALAVANAESLAATRQVVQDNALTGSDQIPPVVLNVETP